MRRAFAFTIVTALAVLACGPREDVTPMIEVQPGAAARALALMGRMGANEKRRDARDAEVDDSDPEEPSETGRLVFACVERLGTIGALGRVPCVAALEAIAATAPDAGDDEDEPTQVIAADGKIAIAIAPGKYRVTASREPDYMSARFDVEVRDGVTTWGPNEGAVVLARAVDTHGYLEANGAAHGFGEPDARVLAASWLAHDAATGGDALDVWSTDDADARAHALADLLARLGAKAPATIIASAASTYLRVDDESLVSRWDARRDADLSRGVHERRDVVLTNGPFLHVTANTSPIGGVARAHAGDVEVIVHVECAAGANATRVTILRARGAAVEPQAVALHASSHAAPGVREADATFHLRASKDDAFVVIAEGAPSSYAMTGAIWIDADGDGESLGRRVEEPTPALRPKVTKGKVTP